MGKEGFFGPAAHFHHRHPPTGWASFSGALNPHAYDLNKLPANGGSPWDATPFMHNGDVKIRHWKTDRAMDHLVRNQDGDELLFVHDGAGELFCDWGRLDYRDGDYIVIPRGGDVAHRAVRADDDAARSSAPRERTRCPRRASSGRTRSSIPAMLDTPAMDAAFRAQQTEDPWKVVVKRNGALSTIGYPFNPLDAVGWHGDLCVVRLNVRDIRPLMSHRYHLPPSAHTTFVGRNFIVCTFVPRPIESDPGALKVPFYHNNDDYDEVIFYHRGDFFSRDNIKPGMVTLHPCGFTHGPHPKAFAAGAKHARKETDEYAVMIDTRFPLDGRGVARGRRESQLRRFVEAEAGVGSRFDRSRIIDLLPSHECAPARGLMMRRAPASG